MREHRSEIIVRTKSGPRWSDAKSETARVHREADPHSAPLHAGYIKQSSRCIFVARPHGLSFTLPLVGRVGRAAAGMGVVLRYVECAPRSTSTPTPLASLATLPTRGRVAPCPAAPCGALLDSCQIARAANAAPPGENGFRATLRPFFRFPQRGGERRRGAKQLDPAPLTEAQERILADARRPPALHRGFVSQRGRSRTS